MFFVLVLLSRALRLLLMVKDETAEVVRESPAKAGIQERVPLALTFVCLFIFPSIYLSIYLSLYLSV